MKHLLSLEAMDADAIETILKNAAVIKEQRGDSQHQPLAGQTWAMIFTKSSTRTRVSFEVGIRELGGSVMFLNANDMQLGRGEPIKDTARVLGRMVHGAVIRTYAQDDVEQFAEWSAIPTINALTDTEHPCQIITDIFTYQELRGPIAGKIVTFVGDGASNVPEAAQREQDFAGYQINEALVSGANESALVMHCLPAYRGKEIDEPTLEAHTDTIFTQAENRLHAQKAILNWLVN